MSMAIAGAVTGPVVQYEVTLRMFIENGIVVAGYRPNGTLPEVMQWYADVINLGISNLNSATGGAEPIPLL